MEKYKYCLWTWIGLPLKLISARLGSLLKTSMLSTENILLLDTSNTTKLGNNVSIPSRESNSFPVKLSSSSSVSSTKKLIF